MSPIEPIGNFAQELAGSSVCWLSACRPGDEAEAIRFGLTYPASPLALSVGVHSNANSPGLSGSLPDMGRISRSPVKRLWTFSLHLANILATNFP